VQDYLGIDLEKVWNIIEKELPSLKSAVLVMLNEMN